MQQNFISKKQGKFANLRNYSLSLSLSLTVRDFSNRI